MVNAWPHALGLDKGINLAMVKGAISADCDFYDWGVAGDAGEVHAVRGTEVAKTVGDETIFIDLHGADYVRAVAIDYVGTVVNAEMGEVAQVAAVLAKEGLLSVGQVIVGLALGATVKGDNDYIRFLAQVGEYPSY